MPQAQTSIVINGDIDQIFAVTNGDHSKISNGTRYNVAGNDGYFTRTGVPASRRWMICRNSSGSSTYVY